MTTPSPQLRRFRRIATALDARWQIPGTTIRFGWESVVGLVPGLGDGIAGAIGSYGLYAGWRLGAPPVVLARMLLNLMLETVVGTVPVLGDLFDLGFKGNLRNLRLLERWVDRPGAIRRRSRWLFAGLVAAALLILCVTLALPFVILAILLHGMR